MLFVLAEILYLDLVQTVKRLPKVCAIFEKLYFLKIISKHDLLLYAVMSTMG